jgi:hypothetical protein
MVPARTPRSSGLAEAPIRYIADDCLKFVRREIKRGRKYDAIIMDPPTYGRGSTGDVAARGPSVGAPHRVHALCSASSPCFF